MKKLAVIAALLLSSSLSMAADYNPRVIKFAATSPKGTPPAIGMELFAKKVQERSDGKIKVRTFPNGVLGGDVQVLSSLQGGVVEMMTWNAGLMINHVTDFGILDFPFLYTDTAKVDAMLDGEVGKMLTDQLPEKNLVGLAFWELGVRNLTNNARPVQSLEDIAGLKIRAQQSPLFLDVWAALGANPTPLPFPEVYAALEQKAIDGQENPVTVINANKFHEVQKHLVLSNHQYNPQSVIISKKFWDGLNAEQKKIISEAAIESAKYQREQARSQVASALDNMKKAGLQVTELSPAELGKLRDKLRPVVAKYAVNAGQDTVKELHDELAKVRK